MSLHPYWKDYDVSLMYLTQYRNLGFKGLSLKCGTIPAFFVVNI